MSQDNYDKITQAGEFLLEAAEILFLEGEGVDVSNQIDSINVFEDLYSPFITGKIVFRDTLDLPAAIGRGGRDMLRLSIVTKGISDKENRYIKGYFHIYKFGDRALIGDRMQLYTFYFTSVEALTDANTQLSKAYSGTGDKIFKDILKMYFNDQTKGMIYDESVENIKFVSNYWLPSKCIFYASENSRTSSGDSSFLFYENRDGFNFRTISSICSEKERLMQRFEESDFSADIVSNGPLTGQATRDPNRDFKIVQEVRVSCVYDYIDVRNSGALKLKLLTYDLLKKTHAITDITSRESVRLNDFPLYLDSVVYQTSPQMMFKLKHYGVHTKGSTSNANYWQRRVSDLKILDALKIEIDVFGRTDYTVGRVVYFDSQIKAKISSDDDPSTYTDTLYSGYYIVTAINHRFLRLQHMCTIELSKESSKSK